MIDADKAREILNEIAADEWGRPILDHLAAKWALQRISELERLVNSQAERIAMQSELLSSVSEKRWVKHDPSDN